MMSRSFFFRLTPVLVLLLLGGCAPKPEYSQNFSPTTDFSRFKTWNWEDEKSVLADNLLGQDPMQRLVRKAVTHELESRGLRLVMENPDLLVSYRGNVFKAVYANPKATGFTSQVAWEQNDSGSWFRRSSREGVLTIFLLDPQTRQPVWSATGREPIADESEARRKIPGVVRTLLSSFPPQRR
ncbi:DUF4136 domain-containing protein [Geothermobacter hydrogeniphilus]|uniref:DUF4136 domain-containing protein n=1 Tax=Geothermobacter hydrogeniphilus TaxID=1969733 RepID=A0A1X0Y666_9BACT|nr:DUF4136 domain-containing protein [Geothermobacter hydrogeniphilus]ORJ60645.1 hypothetical protein B5V00_07370 [Geothermobacter hydrogeniphilus]